MSDSRYVLCYNQHIITRNIIMCYAVFTNEFLMIKNPFEILKFLSLCSRGIIQSPQTCAGSMQCSFLQALQQLHTQWPVDRDTGGHPPPGPPDTAPVHVQGGGLSPPGQDRECPENCGGLTGKSRVPDIL